MPNRTEIIRPMLAIVYFGGSMHRSEVMNLPKKAWAAMPEKTPGSSDTTGSRARRSAPDLHP
ncbi:MAG: hypothetical protein FJY95_09545 [Candidatus Handelsmanbacteria bacterium]|nr:hypothetical protein [Candidatus Handelsmanbacteria bacterium]